MQEKSNLHSFQYFIDRFLGDFLYLFPLLFHIFLCVWKVIHVLYSDSVCSTSYSYGLFLLVQLGRVRVFYGEVTRTEVTRTELTLWKAAVDIYTRSGSVSAARLAQWSWPTGLQAKMPTDLQAYRPSGLNQRALKEHSSFDFSVVYVTGLETRYFTGLYVEWFDRSRLGYGSQSIYNILNCLFNNIFT